MKAPDRWLQYSSCSKIENTIFVACKVPLPKKRFSLPENLSFTPEDLLNNFPDIKLVIDLTNATKKLYYDGFNEFFLKGIKYVKLKCKGRHLPSKSTYLSFVSEIKKFMDEHSNDGLICVHCTHGVNRTGYFICRYMVQELGYTPKEALNVFQASRSHAIERSIYIDDLMKLKVQKRSERRRLCSKSQRSNEINWRSNNFRRKEFIQKTKQ